MGRTWPRRTSEVGLESMLSIIGAVPSGAGRPRAQRALGGRGEAHLPFSGSNQAREGRLVDALAARGDEGRDTLR